MLYPRTHITFELSALGKKTTLDFCHKGVIDHSWKNQTDTCVLTLPRRLQYKNKLLQDILRVGDKVSVRIGYDGYEIREEFAGYVVKIDPKIPMSIHCEDMMWMLKKGTLTRGFSRTTLSEVIGYLVTEYNAKYSLGISHKVINADLGTFRIKEATGSLVLQKLREIYGFVSFFRGNVLHVGFPRSTGIYDTATRSTRYEFRKNIVKTTTLDFVRKEERRLRIKAISNNTNGTKIEKFAGDEDGELHTRNFLNVSGAKLQEYANAELAKAQYDGYQGNIVTMGIPYVQFGEIARIQDPDYPEREGSYFIDAVRTEFGVNGIKRTITIGGNAS